MSIGQFSIFEVIKPLQKTLTSVASLEYHFDQTSKLMTDVRFPVHKLCYVGAATNILLAAVGTSIQSLFLTNGQCLSVWPRDEGEESSSEDEIDDRPTKKLKLEQNGVLHRQESEASEGSIEIKTEGKLRQKGERRRPKIPDLSLPHVSHLVATSDGLHVVAVTAEDKAVRVFKISRSGRLRQLSKRAMPKKSCSLSLTHDEQTIVTADKFGDVYAIPVHPTADYKRKEVSEPFAAFTPSASELTVHTKGNLEALKQQKMQKQVQQKKEGLDFEHKLLLGHVSLLTDLVIARGPVQGKLRDFIITSDRDEHIRVSRGIPQTHIIHTFCMGQTEFVSKLCILPWQPETLVSGNGEPSLRFYNWLHGEEVCRIDLRERFQKEIEASLGAERSMDKLSVSGIWPISYKKLYGLLVALEGVPLLFSFTFSGADFQIAQARIVMLPGNVLDVVDLPDQDNIIFVLDDVHKSGSMKEYREKDETVDLPIFFNRKQSMIPTRSVENCGIELCTPFTNVLIGIENISISSLMEKREHSGNNQDKVEEKIYSVLGDFLYGLENLRKRRGNTLEKDEDEEEDGDRATETA